MGSFEMKKKAKNGLQSRSGCHGLSWPVMVLWMTVKDDGHGRLSWFLPSILYLVVIKFFSSEANCSSFLSNSRSCLLTYLDIKIFKILFFPYS